MNHIPIIQTSFIRRTNPLQSSVEELRSKTIADISGYYERIKTTARRDLRESLAARGIIGSPMAADIEADVMAEYDRESAFKQAVFTAQLTNQFATMMESLKFQREQLAMGATISREQMALRQARPPVWSGMRLPSVEEQKRLKKLKRQEPFKARQEAIRQARMDRAIGKRLNEMAKQQTVINQGRPVELSSQQIKENERLMTAIAGNIADKKALGHPVPDFWQKALDRKIETAQAYNKAFPDTPMTIPDVPAEAKDPKRANIIGQPFVSPETAKMITTEGRLSPLPLISNEGLSTPAVRPIVTGADVGAGGGGNVNITGGGAALPETSLVQVMKQAIPDIVGNGGGLMSLNITEGLI